MAIREIKSEYLISQQIVDLTTSILKKDNYIDIYMHTKGGEVKVGGGIFGEQTISSLAISIEEQSFFEGVISGVDHKLNIDFRIVSDPNDSDFSLYFDKEINSEDGTILGLTVSNYSTEKRWWEVFINKPAFSSNHDYLRYALVHEFGHVLGLEHPFSDTDGDIWKGITSPWVSSYPEESVMSYRSPSGSRWPQNFTINDWEALTKVWDLEENAYNNQHILYDFKNSVVAKDLISHWQDISQSSISKYKDVDDLKLINIRTNSWEESIRINRISKGSISGELVQAKQIIRNQAIKSGSVIDGDAGNDTVRGLAGWDILDGGNGNDLVHGGNGRDIITGGAGADELHGDFGWNTYRSEQDAYKDLIAIKSDQHLSNWIYGKAGNNPNGEKVDIIEGLDAIDEIKIIGVGTVDLSFGETTAKGVSGIGIYAKGALEGLYIGGDLSIAQIEAMTTGETSSQWSYRSQEAAPIVIA